MDTFTLFAVAYAVYMLYNATIGRAQEERKQRFMEEVDRRIRIVRTEPLQDHETILAYDHENNQFLAQGRSEQELEDRIKARYPQQVFVLNKRVFSAMPINVKEIPEIK